MRDNFVYWLWAVVAVVLLLIGASTNITNNRLERLETICFGGSDD